MTGIGHTDAIGAPVANRMAVSTATASATLDSMLRWVIRPVVVGPSQQLTDPYTADARDRHRASMADFQPRRGEGIEPSKPGAARPCQF
jgi:hypothetical protein